MQSVVQPEMQSHTQERRTTEELLNELRKYNFIGKSNVFLGKENKRWNKKTKAKFKELTDEMIRLTSYLPEDTPLKNRRYFLEHLSENNWQCFFPGCVRPRKYTNFKWGFSKICDCQSEEHLNYKKQLMIAAVEKTTIKKYGVKNCSALPEVKNKKAQTFNKNYGVSNIFKYPTFIKNHPQNIFYHNNESMYNLRLASKSTCLNIVDDLSDNRQADYIQSNYVKNNHLQIEELKDFLGCAKTTAYQICRNYNVKYKKRGGISMTEKNIISFIQSLDPDTEIIQNSRQIIEPKELDIYLPEYNLAIEYNGLMFHSQGISKYSMFNTPTKDKNIHLVKTEACEAKGIHLLHINENEWLDPKLQDIWKSVIRNKLKKNTIKIGARKCTFATKEQLLSLSKAFIEDNHLQGSGAIGSIRYGLIYKGELVSLMTFGKSRFSKADYELIRFTNKKNYSVMGAASKLFKAFRKEHKGKIVSYANRRWSDGGLYTTLGFKLKGIAAPNYYYFKPGNIFKLWHRAAFQKHKLPKLLSNFNPSENEQQNMFNNGYRRIYDSGNYVFEL